ncbi:MAG: AraC family transcriptional regulator [Fusobacteriota bacterium]
MGYYKRIQDTVDYIEDNLQREITLEELAKKADLSKYYFHRLFSSMVGDTVMAYIRKRRLARATQELENTDKNILEIAVDNCFNSQAVFTRAFSKYFGITPGRYRNIKSKLALTKKVDILAMKNNNRKLGIQPKVVVREEMKFVGLKLRTTTKENLEKLTIANFHLNIFDKRIDEIEGVINSDYKYGMCQGIPEDETGEKLIHTACVKVGENYSVPDGMELITLPFSRCLIFSHKGNIAKIPETYGYIYRDFLPNSDFELVKGSRDLQVYKNDRFNLDDNEFEFDIYVPVE